MTESLSVAWETRCRLYADGDKLRAEGAKLYTEGDKFRVVGDTAEAAKRYAEGARLRAEGARLKAEGDKRYAEGAKLWVEAIIAAHGNIILLWRWREQPQDYACILGTGEVFEPAMKVKGETA